MNSGRILIRAIRVGAESGTGNPIRAKTDSKQIGPTVESGNSASFKSRGRFGESGEVDLKTEQAAQNKDAAQNQQLLRLKLREFWEHDGRIC